MNKKQQEIENSVVMEELKNFSEYFDIHKKDFTVSKFRTCNAIVMQDKNYTVLVSYRTIVAFINNKDNFGFDILRHVYGYSTTSSQHISKFFRDFNCAETFRYYSI